MSVGPVVDVIVPVYKAEQYLRQCTDSILGQTWKELELWLVDDGSPDHSPELCDQIAAEDGRVHVIHKENGGPNDACICGVRASANPYIMFVDGDDWLERSCIEEMMEHAAGIGAGEVICGGYMIERDWKNSPEYRGNGAEPGEYTGSRLQEAVFDRLLGNEERTIILSRCMKLYSRELIENNIIYCDTGIRMGDDVCLIVPAILDARRLYVCKDAWHYHYRFVHQSIVHAYDPGMRSNMHRLKAALLKIYQEKNRDPEQVEKEYFYLMLLVLKNEIRRGGVPLREITGQIRTICLEEQLKSISARIVQPPHDNANRLLMFIIQNPDRLRIMLVHLVFRLRLAVDRMQAGAAALRSKDQNS